MHLSTDGQSGHRWSYPSATTLGHGHATTMCIRSDSQPYHVWSHASSASLSHESTHDTARCHDASPAYAVNAAFRTATTSQHISFPDAYTDSSPPCQPPCTATTTYNTNIQHVTHTQQPTKQHYCRSTLPHTPCTEYGPHRPQATYPASGKPRTHYDNWRWFNCSCFTAFTTITTITTTTSAPITDQPTTTDTDTRSHCYHRHHGSGCTTIRTKSTTFHTHPHLLGVTTTQTPSPASQPLTATPQPCHTQQFTYTQTSAPARRLSKRQPLHSHRSGRRPPSSRRSRSTRHNRPGERSPPTVPVTLRSRSQLGLSTLTPHTESKWQWRRSDISPQTKRKPQPPHSTEQLSAQFLRMARQQTLQAHRSSASGHATSRQPPTPPQKRRTSTPPQRSPTPPRHTHPQRDRDEEEAEQPAPSFPRQHQQHDTPASRILPPSHKQAPTSQQRFWRAIVPKPFCQLRDAEKPRPLPYEVAAANQFAQTLAELAEGSGLSVDHIQSFSRMIHEAGLQDRTDVLRTTVLDIGQGVYKVIFIPIDMGTPPLAFGQHPDEAKGSVWSYVAAHGTDKEGMRGILLDKFARPSSEDLSISNTQEITPVALYGAATPGTWGEYGIKAVLDNLLRKPKGVQGWIAIGCIDSRTQHYCLEYRNTLKEHEVVFARGLVRTPSRWAWHVSYFSHPRHWIVSGLAWQQHTFASHDLPSFLPFICYCFSTSSLLQ